MCHRSSCRCAGASTGARSTPVTAEGRGVLRGSVDMIDSLHKRGKSFRGSKLKKSVELQGVPTNLHVQLFNVHETGEDGR